MMDPSKPVNGPFYDAQGRMYYSQGNNKSYVSPSAQGKGDHSDKGGLFKGRSTWNQDTGEYEQGLNWTNILSMVVAGTLTVGLATTMMGGGAGAAELASTAAETGVVPSGAEVAAAEAAATGGGAAGGGAGGASLAGEGGAALTGGKELTNLLGDDEGGGDWGDGEGDGGGDEGGGDGGDGSGGSGDAGTDRIKSALKKLGLSGKDVARLLAGTGVGALSALLGPKKHSFWGEKDQNGQSVDPRDLLGEGLSKNRSAFDALSKQIGEGVTLPSAFVQQPGSSSGGGHSFGLSGLDPALSDPGLLHLKGLDVSGKGLPPQMSPGAPVGAAMGFNGLPGGNAGPTLRGPAAPPAAPGPAPTLRPLPTGPQMRLDGGDDMEKAKAAFQMMGVHV